MEGKQHLHLRYATIRPVTRDRPPTVPSGNVKVENVWLAILAGKRKEMGVWTTGTACGRTASSVKVLKIATLAPIQCVHPPHYFDLSSSYSHHRFNG